MCLERGGACVRGLYIYLHIRQTGKNLFTVCVTQMLFFRTGSYEIEKLEEKYLVPKRVV